jgi:cell division protein FtsI (penicillin-binding protein 3)/stage V sporulation protein D (sporulation-specific penicillin-binding protein)
MKRNIGVHWFLFFLAFLVVFFRLYQLHFNPDPRTKHQSESQYWSKLNLSSPRGIIADRNGVPLAISVPAITLFVDPLFWNPKNAELIKPILSEERYRRLKGELKGRYFPVARKLNFEKASEIIEKDIQGLFWVKEYKRFYPHGEFMAQMLGFCDIDDRGLAGLEYLWDFLLYAPPKVLTVTKDASGKVISFPTYGDKSWGKEYKGEVHLTIDSRIQHIVEKYLKKAFKIHRADWAAAVLMNPKTGEILASSSLPEFDPNKRETLINAESLRNNVISRVYEPGSTLKPVMMSIALTEGKATPQKDHFYCTGKIRVADTTIHDVKPHGSLDLKGVIINSCNVGMATIGMRLDPKRTYGHLSRFGFGMKTGVELPGEERGLLNTPELWQGSVPANIAIGQGIGVTPLQLARAISAVANGGYLVKPFLVKEAVTAQGEVVYQGRPENLGQVMSKETSNWLKAAMEDVVKQGTGQVVGRKDVRIAGKTGTAQVAKGGIYQKGVFVSSFVGFWPVEDPNNLLLIVIGHPKGKAHFGSEVAAPVFRDVMEDVLKLPTR